MSTIHTYLLPPVLGPPKDNGSVVHTTSACDKGKSYSAENEESLVIIQSLSLKKIILPIQNVEDAIEKLSETIQTFSDVHFAKDQQTCIALFEEWPQINKEGIRLLNAARTAKDKQALSQIFKLQEKIKQCKTEIFKALATDYKAVCDRLLDYNRELEKQECTNRAELGQRRDVLARIITDKSFESILVADETLHTKMMVAVEKFDTLGSPKSPPVRLPNGGAINNVGNSCFANATMQGLTSVSTFAAILDKAAAAKQAAPLIKAAKDFVEYYKVERHNYIRRGLHMRHMLKELETNYYMKFGVQHDAAEFMTRILEAADYKIDLQKELVAEIDGKKVHKFIKDPIALFTISLTPGTKKTLQELFADFFAKETINGKENPLNFESASGAISRPDSYSLQYSLQGSWPDFLPLQLKRFENKLVQVPVPASAKAKAPVPSEKAAQSAKAEPKMMWAYRSFKLFDEVVVDLTKPLDFSAVDPLVDPYYIKAIIMHNGAGVGNGHYYSFVERGGSWFKCDDSIISKVDPKAIPAKDGYIFLLERKKS